MRIKCPNSDILLELPGDRTDMKFTCPACHKVHRVTISITTPGEDPPPAAANTRSMTRAQPAVPKKYATGAYAPVVDIPIDANFVLLDKGGVSPQPGIDLGRAADPNPARRDRDFANRKTEIIDRNEPPAAAPPPAPPPPPEPPTPPPAPSTASGSDRGKDATPSDSGANAGKTAGSDEPGDNRPEGRRIWDEVTETAPAPDLSADTAETVLDTGNGPESRTEPERSGGAFSESVSQSRAGEDNRRRDIPRRSAARAPLAILLVAVLAGAGYLGWQQYKFETIRKEIASLLAGADSDWEKGEIRSSAQAARDARTRLRESELLPTAEKLYNRAAQWTGMFAPRPSPNHEDEERIETHLRREENLIAFRNSLDPSDPAGVADSLRAAMDGSADDAPPHPAIARAAAASVLDELRREGSASTPEASIARSAIARSAMIPVLPPEQAEEFGLRLGEFVDAQRVRLAEAVRNAVGQAAEAAAAGDPQALARYRELDMRRRQAGIKELDVPLPDLAVEAERPALRQLQRLSDIVDKAVAYARSTLNHPDDDDRTLDELASEAEAVDSPNPAMAKAAAALVDEARAEVDDLLRVRAEVYGRLQSELRRNRDYPGTRLAWAMLRTAFDDPKIEIDPAAFRFDSNRARMEFTLHGLPAVMELDGDNYEKSIVATVGGYSFTHGWPFLMHKPLMWMANLARDMRGAGVDPAQHPRWELLEGPGGPLALSLPGTAAPAAFGSIRSSGGERMIFYRGELLPVTALPAPADSRRVAEDFRRAAIALHDRVMAEESISPALRQALKPVLMGTYQPPSPQDYFDSAFCRRLIEADYLETYIAPMPDAIRRGLEEYRAVLGRLEAGYDDFSVALPDGSALYAVLRLEADLADGKASDQDPETGETLPRYSWRIESPEETVFHSPMPSRFAYAFMLAEHYPGRHGNRPVGVPLQSVVWHATQGEIASYVNGDNRAEGDAERWNRAIAEDSSGRFDPTAGPPGWNFPLHVIQRDDQGDPVVLATLSGIVKSPDFSGIGDEEKRRIAEDEWLDRTAATLATPGELGLIFHQFFRYCSDSPLPELPNLIGSHYGLSDTHQTVHQTLERRWVGRLIGDCDDLAEFFQTLTRRQGKLSHVMQLPAHAAAGYVDRIADDEYRFVVLQTGPVLQFTAPTLNDAVEIAYRFFDRDDGISHMTIDAVPLLLRFADEETRTPFVLSARIYGDAEYADTMIRVQAYWHEHVYSAAIETMEKLVAEDQEVGNIKELGSLYERVGFYDKSEEMRRKELELVKDQPQAAISTLLEIVQLHFQEKDEEKALAALGEMEKRMENMIRDNNAQEFFTALTFRSYWAMYLSRLGQPARAWKLVKYDVAMTKRMGRIAEPVLRTLVVMYDRMCMQRDAGPLGGEETGAMGEVRQELEEAFGRGYFTSDTSYNSIIARYFVMGRYAVADPGRARGLEKLKQDGPYPTEPKDHAKRTRGIKEEDWGWFRITPQLYFALGQEMLDQDEYPELYDPDAARSILELVSRAAARGAGLGSDVAGGDDVIKAEMTLAFLRRDLGAFGDCMRTVKEKDYSSLYDDAAMTFGLQCGLIPTSEFDAWIETFREHLPGRQHYFKVVYRAIDKGNYDHALMMAEATTRFFPDDGMIRAEAEFVRSIIPGLKERKAQRRQHAAEAENRPAA